MHGGPSGYPRKNWPEAFGALRLLLADRLSRRRSTGRAVPCRFLLSAVCEPWRSGLFEIGVLVLLFVRLGRLGFAGEHCQRETIAAEADDLFVQFGAFGTSKPVAEARLSALLLGATDACASALNRLVSASGRTLPFLSQTSLPSCLNPSLRKAYAMCCSRLTMTAMGELLHSAARMAAAVREHSAVPAAPECLRGRPESGRGSFGSVLRAEADSRRSDPLRFRSRSRLTPIAPDRQLWRASESFDGSIRELRHPT